MKKKLILIVSILMCLAAVYFVKIGHDRNFGVPKVIFSESQIEIQRFPWPDVWNLEYCYAFPNSSVPARVELLSVRHLGEVIVTYFKEDGFWASTMEPEFFVHGGKLLSLNKKHNDVSKEFLEAKKLLKIEEVIKRDKRLIKYFPNLEKE